MGGGGGGGTEQGDRNYDQNLFYVSGRNAPSKLISCIWCSQAIIKDKQTNENGQKSYESFEDKCTHCVM